MRVSHTAIAVLVIISAVVLDAADVYAQARLRGVSLDPVPREILLEILEAARLGSARVSSYRRTARKQAELMYAICRHKRGVARARRTYSTAAERIIDVFVKNRKRVRAEVIALMADETRALVGELGPERTTLMHVDSKHYTFDVAPSSIRSRKRFAAAIKAHPAVVRVLEPGVGSERAYHIEISRKLGPVSGMWSGMCSGGAEPMSIQLSVHKADRGYACELSTPAGSTRWRAHLDRRRSSITFEPNAIGPNAIEPNAIGPNAIEPNAIEPNATEPNAIARENSSLSGQFAPDYSGLTVSLGAVTCTLTPEM